MVHCFTERKGMQPTRVFLSPTVDPSSFLPALYADSIPTSEIVHTVGTLGIRMYFTFHEAV